MVQPLLTFVAGFAVCFGAIVLTLRKTHRQPGNGLGMDEPDGLRKLHSHGVLRIGGLAVFGSFVAVLLVIFLGSMPKMTHLTPLIAGCSLIFALGFIDDLRSLPASVKLAGQLAIAILVWSLGLRIDLIANPINGEPLTFSPVLSFAATVVWLVAIPNVLNLVDGMDGLAGGVGLFLCITLGIIGIVSPYYDGLTVLSFGLMGSLIAFLIFNFPPAKIFLGDGGAYFLGFFIAAASLSTSQKSYIGASLAVTLIALGLPILDTVIAFFRRTLKGVPVMRGDSEHIHHRLLLTGMSSGKALFILYGVFLTLSLLALATFLNKSITAWMTFGLLAIFALIAIRSLGYIKSWRTLTRDLKSIITTRREVRYAILVSQVLEMEISRQDNAEVFWFIFEEDLERLGFSVHCESILKPDCTIALNYPFKGVRQWILSDTTPGENPELKREAVASCFIAALYLGIKKFGLPDWEGLESEE